jgi:hypothetical protein
MRKENVILNGREEHVCSVRHRVQEPGCLLVEWGRKKKKKGERKKNKA